MDPSLRVAANDPHLVSLGGGRLSTAVTIHYIPIGTTTVGSSPSCTISLNGPGIKSVHCTIYRNAENQICMEPEQNARTLIDGQAIFQKTYLTQGAMVTIGNSYYLRFNNPQEAQLIRSVIGLKEDGIDIVNRNSDESDNGRVSTRTQATIEKQFLNSIIDSDRDSKAIIDDLNKVNKQKVWNNKDDDQQQRQQHHNQYKQMPVYNNLAPADINNLQCPKVFTADSVTVNMPAKDVLGQKYVNFAKNLIENHRSEKNVTNALLNNQVNNSKLNATNNLNEMKLINIPNNCTGIGMQHQLGSNDGGGGGGNSSGGNSSIYANTNNNNKTEYLVKVNNTMISRDRNAITNGYDEGINLKPGACQIYPLNESNTSIMNMDQAGKSAGQRVDGISDSERLEDILKICSEYADRQNQQHKNAMTLSPIVQNRIKTNGSLPREKKSPFNYDFTNSSSSSAIGGGQLQQQQQTLTDNNRSPRIDAREAQTQMQKFNGGGGGGVFENILLGVGVGVGKYVPQSPRTKIRTTCCLSPKRENFIDKQTELKKMNHNHYEQLIKTFEEKFNFDRKTNEECILRSPSSPQQIQSQMPLQAKKPNKNINNLTLNLMLHSTPKNSPEFRRKPIPAPRTLQQKAYEKGDTSNDSIKNSAYTEDEQLNSLHKDLIAHVNYLKSQITDLQTNENGMEFPNKLNVNSMDLQAILPNCLKNGLENQLQVLQNKMHRLEAQRNATRVMEENKQAKLKQSIEMKQDQISRLKKFLEQNVTDACYREELTNVSESLENDRKAFEDLEFQYLEEESEWHAYCEELHAEEKALLLKIEENRFKLEHLERNDTQNKSILLSAASAPASASTSASLSSSPLHDIECLNKHLVNALHELQRSENSVNASKTYNNQTNNKLKLTDKSIEKDTMHCQEDHNTTETTSIDELKLPEETEFETDSSINQLLYGSTEIIYSKHGDSNNIPNVMSRSVNDNILYNSNNIEVPSTDSIHNSTIPLTLCDDLSNLNNRNHSMNDTNNSNENSGNVGTCKLFMGYDNYEVNVLERKTPSQDDIDRISKLTVDTPISTKDPTTKIFDSIKEIERNRQLLLTQQGHHVIEHERQRMNDLKKKINNEARAQYVSKVSQTQQQQPQQQQQTSASDLNEVINATDPMRVNKTTQYNKENIRKHDKGITYNREHFVQRHSNPEIERNHGMPSNSKTRPLSEANSEINCDMLSENNLFKSGDALSTDDGCNLQKKSDTYEKCSDSINSSDLSNADFNGSVVVVGRKKQLAKYQRPLTRYLPISSPDLNLRKHIESAGHQISLCPHVFVDAYSCRGYLHKLGATFHGWSKRWFVLDRQCNAFIYYADKSERKPRGGAYFTTIDEVYLDHLNASKSSRPHCTFIVKTKKRSFHLQAASSAAARIWIDALITGAQGNFNYYTTTNHSSNNGNNKTTTATTN